MQIEGHSFTESEGMTDVNITNLMFSLFSVKKLLENCHLGHTRILALVSWKKMNCKSTYYFVAVQVIWERRSKYRASKKNDLRTVSAEQTGTVQNHVLEQE